MSASSSDAISSARMQSFSGGKAGQQLIQGLGHRLGRHTALVVAQMVIELLAALGAQQALGQVAHAEHIAVLHPGNGVEQLLVLQSVVLQLDGKTGFSLCSDHACTSLVLAAAWVAAVPPRMYS